MIFIAAALGVIVGWCLRWQYDKKIFDAISKNLDDLLKDLDKLTKR